MGKLLYFSILSTLIVSYATVVGEPFQGADILCTLNEGASTALQKFVVPFGAQHKKEIVWRETPPEDFHAVLALMQVASVAPCTLQPEQEATLSIRAIRLIERNPATQEEKVVSEVTDFSAVNVNDQTVFVGKLFSRIPKWYDNALRKPVAPILTYDEQALIINIGTSPEALFHGWTEPQATAMPGMNYLVEMEVKITGLARLQVGIDYWREVAVAYNTFDSTCKKSNNCEGYLSQWFGPTDDWQTLRVPESFGAQ